MVPLSQLGIKHGTPGVASTRIYRTHTPVYSLLFRQFILAPAEAAPLAHGGTPLASSLCADNVDYVKLPARNPELDQEKSSISISLDFRPVAGRKVVYYETRRSNQKLSVSYLICDALSTANVLFLFLGKNPYKKRAAAFKNFFKKCYMRLLYAPHEVCPCPM